MKVTVLVDNIGSCGLKGEWGLSLLIEYAGRKYLLDAGGSRAFSDNAAALGIDLSEVECAVLSHAHYDHSIGMEVFLGQNHDAELFMSPAAKENCYSGKGLKKRYIGLPDGFLSRNAGRISMPEGITEIADGVYIVPHSAPGLKSVARRSHLYVRRWWGFAPDDFSHEQSLVFRVTDGLVVFNSCSHTGADVIAGEIRRAFPGEEICAYVGGLHLFRLDDRTVRDISARIASAGIKKLYTGHCTGDRAFEILRERFGSSVVQLQSGMEITF